MKPSNIAEIIKNSLNLDNMDKTILARKFATAFKQENNDFDIQTFIKSATNNTQRDLFLKNRQPL